MKSRHLVWGENSLSVQQRCLHPHTTLAPESVAPWKAPLCRTLVFSPSPCGEVEARARTAPGTEDTHPKLLLLQIRTINRTICALWLSLLAAVHPIPGLVLSNAPFGEEAGVGSRNAGKEIWSLSLWEESQTLTSTRSKIGKKRGGSKDLLANVTANFQGDPFSSLNLSPEQKERFSLKAEHRAV